MFSIFKKKENKPIDKNSLIGRRAELYHDATIYQYGTVFIDDVRYSVKLEDGSELCKGNMVEVVGVTDCPLIVKRVTET